MSETQTTRERGVREKLLKVLEELSRGGETVDCVNHPREPAVVVCSGCAKPLCGQCADLDAASMTFLCGNCREASIPSPIQRTLGWFREPLFYVGMALVLALVAYIAGVGNPSEKHTARRDAGRPWDMRDGGRLWVRQAARAKERCRYLEKSGKAGDAQIWAGLAARALGKAQIALSDAPVALDLAVGRAAMLGRAGSQREAYDALVAMAPDVPLDSRTRPAYLYERGKLAAVLKVPNDSSWDTLRQSASSEKVDPLELFQGTIQQIAALAGEDRLGAALKQRVRQVCGTGRSAKTLVADIEEPQKEKNTELKIQSVVNSKERKGKLTIRHH